MAIFVVGWLCIADSHPSFKKCIWLKQDLTFKTSHVEYIFGGWKRCSRLSFWSLKSRAIFPVESIVHANIRYDHAMRCERLLFPRTVRARRGFTEASLRSLIGHLLIQSQYYILGSGHFYTCFLCVLTMRNDKLFPFRSFFRLNPVNWLTVWLFTHRTKVRIELPSGIGLNPVINWNPTNE